jgi:hypothetical protein
MNAQPTLRLPMPPAEVTLIPLDMAAAIAGLHLDHALERVESGEWRWAWDLAAGHERRTLHVWRECLTNAECGMRNAEFAAGSALPAPRSLLSVLDAVIGTPMPEVRLVSLETRWSVRAQTIRRWLAVGDLSYRRGGHTLWLARASLVAFLERRLVA